MQDIIRTACFYGLGLGLWLTASIGQAADTATAAQLVTAMKIDQMTLLGLQLGMRNNFKQNKITAANLQCIEAIPLKTLTDPYVRLYQEGLSQEEAQAALTFFAGKIGKKYVRRDLYLLYRSYGENTDQAMPILSKAELDKARTFFQSSVAMKIARVSQVSPNVVSEQLARLLQTSQAGALPR